MRLTLGGLLLCLTGLGCDVGVPASADPPARTTHPPRPNLSARPSDPPPAGRLSGRVVWHGPPPHTLAVRLAHPRPDNSIEWVTRPSPNVPIIDPATGGLAEAVVFLRGIDPAAARAWDQAPVTVEMHTERPMVRQGDGLPHAVGFVRRGDAVTFVSRQEEFHSVRIRGAAFWSLTLPGQDRPRSRQFDEPGLVELKSGAGFYWMHGYLWVSEHPYFARTDSTGHWDLAGVPAGDYELVVWHPNWRVDRLERDSESGAIARAYFRSPVELVRRVSLRDGEAVVMDDVIVTDGP